MRPIPALIAIVWAVLLASCTTTQTRLGYVDPYVPAGKGHDVVLKYVKVSESEFAFVVNQLKRQSGFVVKDQKFASGTGEILCHIDRLDDYKALLVTNLGLKAVYDGQSEFTPLLTETRYFDEFAFTRLSGAGSRAKYEVSVVFDPNSRVLIGGYSTITNPDGQAFFRGTGINLADAKKGRIYLTDNFGNRVLAVRSTSNTWVVETQGTSLGKDASKSITVEALK